MNRRNALKNIGLSMGYMVATPTIISILQSCETIEPWTPGFLSADQGVVLQNLVDLILPKTETVPGAKELNVAKFIDLYIDKVAEPKSQNQFSTGISAFMTELGIQGDVKAEDIDIESYEPYLAKYLKATEEEQKIYGEQIGLAMQEAGEEGTPNIPKEALLFSFLSSVRGLTIWGFKTHKTIGTEHMAYVPIPGREAGCISVEEATGGKAYSL
jgi:hypothetical protein